MRHDALDLRVVGFADDDHEVAAVHEFLGGLVRLAHVRTGRVNHVQTVRACGGDDCGIDAVGANHQDAVLDLVETLRDDDAALVKRRDRLGVVNERAKGVDVGAALGGLLGELERAFDSVADAGVPGDFDSHGYSPSAAVRAMAMRRMISSVMAFIRSLRPPSAKSSAETGMP